MKRKNEEDIRSDGRFPRRRCWASTRRTTNVEQEERGWPAEAEDRMCTGDQVRRRGGAVATQAEERWRRHVGYPRIHLVRTIVAVQRTIFHVTLFSSNFSFSSLATTPPRHASRVYPRACARSNAYTHRHTHASIHSWTRYIHAGTLSVLYNTFQFHWDRWRCPWYGGSPDRVFQGVRFKWRFEVVSSDRGLRWHRTQDVHRHTCGTREDARDSRDGKAIFKRCHLVAGQSRGWRDAYIGAATRVPSARLRLSLCPSISRPPRCTRRERRVEQTGCRSWTGWRETLESATVASAAVDGSKERRLKVESTDDPRRGSSRGSVSALPDARGARMSIDRSASGVRRGDEQDWVAATNWSLVYPGGRSGWEFFVEFNLH